MSNVSHNTDLEKKVANEKIYGKHIKLCNQTSEILSIIKNRVKEIDILPSSCPALDKICEEIILDCTAIAGNTLYNPQKLK